MSAEIRRKRTNDPEMDAMAVLVQALEPLSEHARKRLLDWAADRFLREPAESLTDSSMAALSAHFKAIKEYADQHGVTERQVMHTLSAQRQREGLAPVDEAKDPAVNELPA